MRSNNTRAKSQRAYFAKLGISVLTLLATIGCGGSRSNGSEELERRRGSNNTLSPQPKPATNSSQTANASLEQLAKQTVASAVSLSSSSIDSGSSSQENSAAQSLKKVSGNSAVNYSFNCPAGGTGSASGSRTRQGTESTFASYTTAELTLNSCTTQSNSSTSYGIVFDGSVSYSRTFQVSSTELTSETFLNGSLSSEQSGMELCSVTYDNLEVSKYLNFKTGEISNTVTGSVVASCAGTTPAPYPTESPVAGPSPTPAPTPVNGGGSNPSTVTVLCTFVGVPITALPATVDIHCEIAE